MTLVTLAEVSLFLNTAGESWTTGPHCSSSGPCFAPAFNFLNYTLSVCAFVCHSIHVGAGRQLLINSSLPPRGCWVQGQVVRLGWYPLSRFIIPVSVLEARFDVFTWLTWHLHVSQAGLRGIEMVGVDHNQSVHTFLPTIPLYQWGHESSRKDRDFGLWVLAGNSVWERMGMWQWDWLSPSLRSVAVYTLSLSS